MPIRVISSDCSKQSSRDKRTVDAQRNPDGCQSESGTSNSERGDALVTAAATASAPSSHRIKTGRFFVPPPDVNGILATQNSPGRIVIVQTFVLGCVTIQECRVISRRLAWCLNLFRGRRDRERHHLMFLQRQRRKRPQDSCFVDCIGMDCHPFSISAGNVICPSATIPASWLVYAMRDTKTAADVFRS